MVINGIGIVLAFEFNGPLSGLLFLLDREQLHLLQLRSRGTVVGTPGDVFFHAPPLALQFALFEGEALFLAGPFKVTLPARIEPNAGKCDELPRDSATWQLVPHLVPAEGDARIYKKFESSFEDTKLEDELAKVGATHIVLAGAMTNWCIRATAYGALIEAMTLH